MAGHKVFSGLPQYITYSQSVVAGITHRQRADRDILNTDQYTLSPGKGESENGPFDTRLRCRLGLDRFRFDRFLAGRRHGGGHQGRHVQGYRLGPGPPIGEKLDVALGTAER